MSRKKPPGVEFNRHHQQYMQNTVNSAKFTDQATFLSINAPIVKDYKVRLTVYYCDPQSFLILKQLIERTAWVPLRPSNITIDILYMITK